MSVKKQPTNVSHIYLNSQIILGVGLNNISFSVFWKDGRALDRISILRRYLGHGT